MDYRIIVNRDWETVYLEISQRHGDQTQLLRFEGDGKGNWKYNGKKASQFNGCIDVDISLTPFTNTLPIRRLKLKPNEVREIRVIYCDLLEGKTEPARQKYTCLSKTEYKFENVPNDFEATIRMDELGLVVDYPGLFTRKGVKAP